MISHTLVLLLGVSLIFMMLVDEKSRGWWIAIVFVLLALSLHE